MNRRHHRHPHRRFNGRKTLILSWYKLRYTGKAGVRVTTWCSSTKRPEPNRPWMMVSETNSCQFGESIPRNRHRGNAPFCRAVTSISSQQLLHKMTNSRAVLIAEKLNTQPRYFQIGSLVHYLSQHKLCTRKMELAIEMKFYLDFHWVTHPWRRRLTNGSDIKYVFPLTNGSDVKYVFPMTIGSDVKYVFPRCPCNRVSSTTLLTAWPPWHY